MVVGGMYPGIQNAETCTVEITADACKQVGLVGCVNQYLQAFSRQRLAGAHDRFGGAHVTRQVARVPRNVCGLVPHEIAHVQCFPQGFVGFERKGVEGQLHERFALAGLDFGRSIRCAAAQGSEGGTVQVFQQLAFPRIPDLGTGAADVCHGEQIEGGQIALIANPLSKGRDHLGVTEVLLLRDPAHCQMLADQEFDELCVLHVHAMLTAEAPDFFRADVGVIAPPAFADIVEQRRDVENPGLVPARRQVGAERVFVRMFCHEKAPHVAQHHQDVLVHGVDVEQVVLHLPHDAAEHPEVATQHRRLVHEPHGMGDARRLLKNAHEGLAVDRIAPEGGIHHRTGVVQRSQGARRQVFQAHRGLVEQKRFQNRVRVFLVQIVAGHFNEAGFFKKPLVDRAWFVGRWVQPLFNVEQQDLAELGHRLGRPVVAAHQGFAGAHRQTRAIWCLRAVAKRFRHRGLQVEHEAVFVASCRLVQARPYQAEQGFVALNLSHLKRGGHATGGQFFPAAAQSCSLGNPQDELQVSQAAG